MHLLPPPSNGLIPVLMYGARPPSRGTCSIGGPVRDAVRRLGAPVSRAGFDLLTIAMAVTAADTFVDKAEADDGWARVLRLSIPIADPDLWKPAVPILQRALHFLSGDIWDITLMPDGPRQLPAQKRGQITVMAGHDCVSLFSGGMDSGIGALDLLAKGHRPLLISHSYRGDSEKQISIRNHLPVNVSRFAAVAHPISWLGTQTDVQMRTRSFNFLAYGTLVGATLAQLRVAGPPVELFVPENGLIALNPPMTRRRIGALSTRTTHPHFLRLFQQVLDTVGLPVKVVNPYSLKTKGEMLTECLDQDSLNKLVSETVSCGKWKRTHVQCGKCVPCIIRRASFHAAGMHDATPYGRGLDLSSVMNDIKARDDLMAMILASRRLPHIDASRWVPQAGPLPSERQARDDLVAVATRGMNEVRTYLASLSLL
ncbi:Qat anti-phage system QueC-like protein QatC [Pseudomonas kulmbachensis]|uniref:Qat anti-phage system QueC-like protein QatC n=2 Tax=Pseudomonas kulmbachensis TaxID=3043408 RepID=A0ABW7LYN5_9PSED